MSGLGVDSVQPTLRRGSIAGLDPARKFCKPSDRPFEPDRGAAWVGNSLSVSFPNEINSGRFAGGKSGRESRVSVRL
jgi:hypothetical protein